MRALFALALAVAAAVSFAQDTPPKAELKLDKTTAVAGQAVKGKIILTFAEGLHGYQNPPSGEYQIPTKIDAVKGTTLVKAIYPKGVPFMMAGEEKPSMVYQGTVEIPVIIKASAKAGRQTLKLSVNYQQCNDSACFPPGKVDVSGTLTVTAPPKKKGK